MSDEAGFISYKNSRTVVSETVRCCFVAAKKISNYSTCTAATQVSRFLYGMLCGTAWGLVDPFGPVEAVGECNIPSPLTCILVMIPLSLTCHRPLQDNRSDPALYSET